MARLCKSSLLLLAATMACAPAWSADANGSEGLIPATWILPSSPETVLLPAGPAARMAPELALATFQQRAERQLSDPVSYSAETVVEAELPDTAQRGEYRLRRRFIAPKTLLFTPVRFVGDNFVKSNIIGRLLQTEVDHITKGEGAQTAITEANYKFSYKGSTEIAHNSVHVFQVKPRRKRPGLFKGRIFVDASNGSLRRAEGTLVKTQSFFVKKIEFVQDYDDFDGYTLPVHARSIAKTRLLGRAVVEIDTRNYQLNPQATASAAVESGGNQ